VASYRRICVALSLALGVALGPAMAQEDQDRPAADDPHGGCAAQQRTRSKSNMVCLNIF